MTPERDGASALALALALGPIVLAADNVPASIDLRDAGKATLLLGIGAGGIVFDGVNKIEFKLTHSDDDITYVNVTDDDVVKDAYAPAVITNGIVRALTAAHAAPTAQKLGYIGGKRYLKLLADFSGAHGTGTPVSAHWVKARLELQGAV
jgi:tryptophan synthase beta subunit